MRKQQILEEISKIEKEIVVLEDDIKNVYNQTDNDYAISSIVGGIYKNINTKKEKIAKLNEELNIL